VNGGKVQMTEDGGQRTDDGRRMTERGNGRTGDRGNRRMGAFPSIIASWRNIKRFPPDFMFSLTRDEIRNISQIVICSGIKHARNVNVFTEQHTHKAFNFYINIDVDLPWNLQ